MHTKTVVYVAVWIVALAIFTGGLWLNFNTPSTPVQDYAARVNTTLLNFDVTWVARHDESESALFGGIALHRRGILVGRKADGGEIVFLPVSGSETLPTGLTLPSGNTALVPERTPGGRLIPRHLVRQNDIAYLGGEAGAPRLLVSYNYFHDDRQCFTGRLAQLVLPADWVETIEAGGTPVHGDWTVVFETEPCLPLVERGVPFIGHQAGGQSAVSPDGQVYLSIGDYGFDGLGGKLPPYPQRPDASYGRILKFVPVAEGVWTPETIAIGLRNPQGLDFDDDGRLWETEHAAMGGDELNLILPGRNYGWPAVTLGVNYVDDDSDAKFWPFSADVGHHPGYTPPVYAWVPSIAPSNVRFVSGISPRWDGNLLVAALKEQSIVRLQLDDKRVVVAETIHLGRRVRQVEVGHGRIYVLFDGGELAVLTPRAMEDDYVDIGTIMDEVYDPTRPDDVTIVGAGSILTRRGCIECHSGPGAPVLRDIVDTDIASQSGVTYSSALAAKAGAWSEDALRAFLSDPQAFAPGTTMPQTTLSEGDVARIIEAMRVPEDH